ncbi:MAG: hypothetical protein HWQ43_16750 [Nostoc sp. JL31]|uniref:hypothetical protein n=1 Tax=Nostoc sp. JL31 TaxID=2815395 RepID=UPI0025E5952D|nr:hypothetical protein [Nostoc sp. JL31]MBN3890733.1 hypothetical protein [Nostoc sp. JL31]
MLPYSEERKTPYSKDIAPENLVFLDETGVLLGLARTHARSQQGTRAYDQKPFYR